MLTVLFIICMLCFVGKLFFFGIRAAWGISKMLLSVVLLPLILIGMVAAGLIYIAFPVLIILGVVSLIGMKA